MTAAGVLTTVYSFGNSVTPSLIQGADGNLYGIAGLNFFKMTPGGTLIQLRGLQISYTGTPYGQKIHAA
jgi:hypothetical protein